MNISKLITRLMLTAAVIALVPLGIAAAPAHGGQRC
jgi:hypothetical protein